MTESMIARLDATAQRLGNTRAGVVKLCLEAFLQSFEKSGMAALPLNWEEVLRSLDGRTREAGSEEAEMDPTTETRDGLEGASPGLRAAVKKSLAYGKLVTRTLGEEPPPASKSVLPSDSTSGPTAPVPPAATRRRQAPASAPRARES